MARRRYYHADQSQARRLKGLLNKFFRLSEIELWWEDLANLGDQKQHRDVAW